MVIIATGSVPKQQPVGGADGPAIFNVWQVLNGEAEARPEGLPHRLRRPPPGHGYRRVPGRPGQDRPHHYLQPLRRRRTGADPGSLPVPPATPQEGCHLHPRHRGDGGERRDRCQGDKGIQCLFQYLGRVGAVRLGRPGHGTEVGRCPLHLPERQGEELYRIGDSVAPRKVDMAIWEGHKIGREI